MRLYRFITEDADTALDYKKAVFDLKVVMGEIEYMKKAEVPTDPDRKRMWLQKKEALKWKLVALKDKIQTLASKLTEKIDPSIQDVLDKIPNKKDIDVERASNGHF